MMPRSHAGQNFFERDSIELSPDAQLEAIHQQIISGKPLRGVSYSEFKKYSMNMKYYGQSSDYEVRRLYEQALRGYDDILSKRDFYSENFILTREVQYSAEFQEEGRKLRERCMSGEELTAAEDRVMYGANGKEADAAVKYRSVTNLTNKWNKIFDELGVSGDELKHITVTLKDSKFSVRGIANEEKRLAVEARFNQRADGAGASSAAYIWLQNMKKQPGDVFSQIITETECFLEKFTGGAVTITDLAIDNNGDITGLSPELSKYFENVDTSDMNTGPIFDDPQEHKVYWEKKEHKHYLEEVLKAVEHDGYDIIKANMSEYGFAFDNGRIVFR
jgi:acetolactate synthase regulatory subunit